MSQPAPTPAPSRPTQAQQRLTSPAGHSRSAIEPPPIPTSPVSEPNVEANLRDYERAQLHLFQSNFNLMLQMVEKWVSVQKQQAVEMEVTLGKVRSFAELAERIVQASDSQLEKLLAITDALVTVMEQLQASQNPQQQQPSPRQGA